MSELKAFDIVVAEEGFFEGIVKYRRAVYDKTEADKVIEELKDKLQAANEQIENLINSASSIMLFQDRVKDNKRAQLRHSKYKRCLDKAEICCEKKENCYNLALRKYSKDEAYYLVRKSYFWQDWEFRWLKLAYKFKEAK